jgi:hypothetical protein
MSVKYIIFYSLVFLIGLFMWYFVTCFCAVYPNSAINWFVGGIISIVLNLFMFEIVVPFIQAGVRYIAIRCKSK